MLLFHISKLVILTFCRSILKLILLILRILPFPCVLILSRASEFIIILCSPHSTIEGPRELSQNRTRTPANKIGFRWQGKVSRPEEIICCQIYKNICCLISANTLKCIISHRIIYPYSDICARQKFEMIWHSI